ncbi:MAG TPA: sigma-54-dependent Fis family transcriptional regulator [Symbiobacteriaceae bacterium]
MNARPKNNTSNRFEIIRRGWQMFQQGQVPTGIREPILRSWERSRKAGVNPALPGGLLVWDRHQLALAQAANQELIDAARGPLRDLEQALIGTGLVLALLDANSRALLVRGDSQGLAAAEQILLVPGSDWSESEVGTNAMGTALVEGTLVSVIKAEHYLESLHPWSCVAAPIRHPRTGSVVGLLDLSGTGPAIGQQAEMVLRSSLAAIESQLAAADLQLRNKLLEAYSDELIRPRTAPLAAVDRYGDIVKATDAALAALPAPELKAAMKKVAATGTDCQIRVTVEDKPATLILRPVRWEDRVIGALAELSRPLSRPRSGPQSVSPAGEELVGRNPAWLATVQRALQAARTDFTILITGETGTGKEVLAKAIHRASPRSKGPWIAVNCGALSPTLAASQLFGYVGGAFTGANPKGSPGLVEAASGGTLFLDEVGELPPEVQVALLRFLEERQVYRIGSHRPIPVDVRIIAATNQDLAEMVRQGRFRQDLYYRLNVVHLHIPPLRERREDILPLVEYAYRRLGVVPPDLGFSSCQQLTSYSWPGNVRELMNLVEQAVALNEDPANLLPLPSLGSPQVQVGEYGEEERIRKALADCRGNVAAAARQLGISRTTLYRKLEQYGIRLKRQIDEDPL